MKVMLLCAGLGTRLRPLTEFCAKPALPVLNKPLIVHTLDLLNRAGVREVMINLHYLAETIVEALESFAPSGIQIHYSRENPVLGSAGGIKKAEAFFQGRRGIILNGDTLMDFSLEDLLSFHEKSGAMATLVLKQMGPQQNYAPVFMDSERSITSIAGKPPLPAAPKESPFLYTGLQVIEPGVFDEIPSDIPWEMNAKVYPDLLAKGRPLAGYVVPWFWLDFGTPRDYLESNLSLLDRMSTLPFRAHERGLAVRDLTKHPDRERTAGGVLLEKGVKGTDGIIVGPGSVLQRGVTCSRTVILDNSVIGQESTVVNSILGSGVVIPPGSVIEDRVMVRRPDGRMLTQDLT